MALAIIPILLIIVGALMYGLSSNPKLAEIGRLMLAAGLFALAFQYASRVIQIGSA